MTLNNEEAQLVLGALDSLGVALADQYLLQPSQSLFCRIRAACSPGSGFARSAGDSFETGG